MFMRSAYVVYDIDNAKIGIAQTNINSTKSNPIEVKAGVSNFPKVTGVIASVIQTPSTPTSISETSGKTSPTSPNDPATSPPGPAGGLSTGAKAGVGIGAAAGILALVGLLLFVMRHRKRQKSENRASRTSELETERRPEMATQYEERVELEAQTKDDNRWKRASELDAGYVSPVSPDINGGRGV